MATDVMNIRDDVYEPTQEFVSQSASHYEAYEQSPQTAIINGTGVITATVKFDFLTADKWFDMSSSFFEISYTGSGVTTGLLTGQHIARALWSKGTLKLNAVKIADSANYLQDSIFSLRRSKELRAAKSDGELDYLGEAKYTAAAPGGYEITTDRKGISCDTLDAFWLRTKKILFPPHSRIEIELVSAPNNGIVQWAKADTTGVGTIVINKIALRGYKFMANGNLSPDGKTLVPVPKRLLSFLTINSSMKPVSGTNAVENFTVVQNLVGVGVALTDEKANQASAQDKLYLPSIFNYANSGVVSTAATYKMNTLEIKYGSDVLYKPYMDNTYDFRSSYRQFLNASNQQFTSGYETLDEWKTQGPIYLVKVVKQPEQQANKVYLRGAFAAAPVANTVNWTLFAVNQQMVFITYNADGAHVSTSATI